MRLELETDNEAFDDGGYEVARILRGLADSVEAGATSGHLRDVNGNAVGTWEL